ncbi:MAG: hypothetical protein IKG95_01275 [Bacteroidales bacterium]|nr:hypothetical protein [Bacteroidales bacterium]
MKKRIIAIAAALMMATAPAMAQVFIMEEDDYNGNRVGTTSLDVDLPGVYDSGDDWFTPVGEGLLVLAGLAGAYLVGKRRKEE